MTKDGEIQEDKRNLDHYTCFYGKMKMRKTPQGMWPPSWPGPRLLSTHWYFSYLGL